MFKQPLFGEDSSPHRTSTILSAIITLCAWIVFCFMSFFIKFKPKTPEYKEIQIVLSSTPVEEKHEEQSSASAASAVPEPVEGPVVETAATPEIPNPVENPVAEAKVDAPKETPKPAKAQTQPAKQPKQATTAKTTDSSKKVNFDDYQYATDYSQGVDFNQVTNNKKTTWDDSMFDNSSSEPEPQVSQQVKTVTNQSSYDGSTASTTTKTNQSVTSSSKSQYQDNNSSPDKSTLNQLQGIKGATPKTSSKNGINTDFTLEDDANTIQMSNGKRRRVIVSSPIDLSPEAASKIDFKTYTFVITFKVLPSGYILASDVTIKDEFILDQIIIDEIKSQISKWRLEEADYTATATFNFTIKKQ